VAKARYLVEAHLLEGHYVAELAKTHGVHRSWIYRLLARYREGGDEALEPRSRAPRSSPNRTPEEMIRDRLPPGRALRGGALGLDDLAHLAPRGADGRSAQKRLRCSLIRFEAQLPNEMWQADITHWQLAGGQGVEILNMIDDHSRLFVASRARSAPGD
jgi:transposase InsO family protein